MSKNEQDQNGKSDKSDFERQPNKPMTGSKKAKNRNHSRNNHGEGS